MNPPIDLLELAAERVFHAQEAHIATACLQHSAAAIIMGRDALAALAEADRDLDAVYAFAEALAR